MKWPVSAVMAGIDGSGARHLLIPVADESVVTGEGSGAVVTLRKRTLVLDGVKCTYLDLACKRHDLFDQFAMLSAEVLDRAESSPAEAVGVATTVLESWRELLRSLTHPGLDRGGVIGLYGELIVLKQILAINARRGVEAWSGPRSGRHDFQRGADALEIKTSTARVGRPIQIHALDQLEWVPNTRLFVWWIRLEVSVGRGESLRMLVDQVLEACLKRADLEQSLAKVGYKLDQPQQYERPLFTQVEARLYRVDDTFPSLTHKDLVGGQLPHGVLGVVYDIDVSGDQPIPVTSLEEQRLLHSLSGDS
jgi:hypothetical protein